MGLFLNLFYNKNQSQSQILSEGRLLTLLILRRFINHIVFSRFQNQFFKLYIQLLLVYT